MYVEFVRQTGILKIRHGVAGADGVFAGVGFGFSSRSDCGMLDSGAAVVAAAVSVRELARGKAFGGRLLFVGRRPLRRLGLGAGLGRCRALLWPAGAGR